MSEPFLAEIRLVGFDFAPRGWAFCDGQILPISQNQSLFSLLGTTYGGDGRTTFALPDLRGRVPVHVGDGFNLGQKGGAETVALTTNEIPGHTHAVQASANAADAPISTGNVLASANNLYHGATNLTALRSGTAGSTGGGQGHDNMSPWLAVNYCIALRGLFPSRN